MTDSPLHILETRFGYSAFRLEQEAIIQSVLNKRDTFVLMPTGGGKSLCYQIPALIFEGLTLVVSPLIALMKDQVDALRLNGIEAAYLNSTLSYPEQESVLRNVLSGKTKLLYVAPEKLLRAESNFFHSLTACTISLIAIDEAHCISQWGHDFRPEYLMLAQLKRALPQVPVIALTATADRLTRKDIVEKLELSNPATFVSSFNRANIRYSVEEKKNSVDKLLRFLDDKKDDAGIIYCLSRNSTESLAQELVGAGFAALPYHAGLEKETRARHQDLFLRDEVKIIVATIAFGMGIDKSNVRYVVHMDLPKSIESFYQETGRAGRDGIDSEALLFYSYADVAKMKSFVSVDDNPEQTEISLKKLDQMSQYGQLRTCRRKYLLNYFDESTTDTCGNCDVCLTHFEETDATTQAQKVLSAVTRLQERYGAGYVIDFLRGADTAKIQHFHKELKTFGIGAGTSKEEWSHIIRELVSRRYLLKTEGDYPLLKLSPLSNAVLRGETKVIITVAKGKEDASPRDLSYETALFQQLKNIRREIASRENVPAYIVLSDATLIELATWLPLSISDLSRISGFGVVKLERYGDAFLNCVVTYARNNRLESRIAQKTTRRSKTERETTTIKETLSLFKQGKSPQQIATTRNLALSTIEGHLAFYVQSRVIPVEQLVDASRIAVILAAADKLDTSQLAPIKEFLGETYTYGEIRLSLASR